jgi:four helix bundle protein
MPVNTLRDLLVWQKSMQVAKQVYKLTAPFPKYEVYGISSQLQRAAVSIPANIAEGHARNLTKEFLHHLSIARGSLAELETLLSLADQLGHCRQEAVSDILQKCAEVSRMLSGLCARLKQRLTRDSCSLAPPCPPPKNI